MAYLVIVVNDSKASVQNLNDRAVLATKPLEGVNALINYLSGSLAGSNDPVIQVTTRDTDPAVATHGSGSQQVSYNLA